MKQTLEQIHLASQYLAAAGISFLPQMDDDSHINLGWDEENNRLTTHPFGKAEFQIGLNIKSGELEWLKNGRVVSKINVLTSTHKDLLNWINREVLIHEIGKDYQYQFNYDLPYAPIGNGDSFHFDQEERLAYIRLLTTAQRAFKGFLVDNDLASPIRLWPHHFDLGIYAQLNAEMGLYLSAGLAISDSLVEDVYYYASGWKEGKVIPTSAFKGLDQGDWRSDWAGATLLAGKVNEAEAKHFLKQAQAKFLI